jgi:hypothetical protein
VRRHHGAFGSDRERKVARILEADRELDPSLPDEVLDGPVWHEHEEGWSVPMAGEGGF